jgi:phospholipid transport system substrate-binding protein
MQRTNQGWTGRLFAAVFAAVFLAALARPAAADGSPGGAAAFIERLGQEAVDELSQADVPEATRQAQFLDLLERGFAVEDISRFVLGRYWRVASEQQQHRFQDAFKRIVAQRFLPLFQEYGRDDFAVTGARPDPAQPSLYAVRTLVARPGQTGGDRPMVEVTWRVRPAGDSYEIVDIKAEGVSMAITLRSEYNAAIQRAGGNVANLIAMLEDNLAKGAYAPKSTGDLSPSGNR